MNRRDFLYRSSVTLGGLATAGLPRLSSAEDLNAPYLTPAAEIQSRFLAASPLHGATIPKEIVHRLGATHYDGKYSFTEKPYLVEGADALQKFGMRCIKLWLGTALPGYEYNWKNPLGPNATLLDCIKLPAFQEVLHKPFEVYSFEIFPVQKQKLDRNANYLNEEAQFEELAKYLLATFKNRDVTFILQHWEGDWILRGDERDKYKIGNKVDASERSESMIRWLQARQDGVERARSAYPKSRCRVFHVSEVNRVYDTLHGLPGVITDVLPHVAVDGVSWSSYDGMGSAGGSAVKTWQGLDIIEHFSGLNRKKKPFLMVGEVGLAEHRSGLTPQLITNWWDTAMGVFLAREIPYIFQWELFDNETMVPAERGQKPITDVSRLAGFWLIKPDGTLGIGAKYLQALLQNAGKKLPADFLRSVT